VSLRNLPCTIASLLAPNSANPFPGRSLARYWDGTPPGPPDPVLSQLEDPQLRGESFRTENVIKLDSLIDDDHILIESAKEPPQLFELFKDPKQVRNLASVIGERSRVDRMRATIGNLLGESID